MSKQFDPYLKWLGIREKDQPPTHYRLLGIDEFEHDPDVIETAADKQMLLLRTKQSSQHRDASQKLLNEVAAAKMCLLDPQRKAVYDQQLRAATARQAPAQQPAAPGPMPSAFPQPAPRPMMSAPLPGPVAVKPIVQAPDPLRERLQRKPVWQQTLVLVGAAAVLLLIVGSAVGLMLMRRGGGSQPIAAGPTTDANATSDSSPIAETSDNSPKVDNTASPSMNASPPAIETRPADPQPSIPISPEPVKPDASPKTPPADPQKLAPPPVAQPAAPPANGAIALLDLVDLQRDVVKGPWEMKDGALVGGGTSGHRVVLPVDVPSEYDLDFSVERLRGNQLVVVGLPVGDRYVAITLGAYQVPDGILDGHRKVLNELPGEPSTVDISMGKRHNVICRVRDKELSVEFDGAKVVSWNCNPASRITDPPGWESPNPRRCFLGSNSLHAFRDVQLIPATPAPSPMPSPTPPPSDDTKRLPVPELAALEKAAAQIKEIFAKEFTAAEKDPSAAAALVSTLRNQADKSADDPTARFALLRAARELAIASQGNETAIAVTRTIANGYDVERWDLIAETMKQLYAAARTTDDRKRFTALAAKLAAEAMQAESIEAAVKIVDEGQTAALRARDADLRVQMSDLADEVKQRHVVWKSAQTAQETLSSTPDDPAANETWGSYLCLVRGDWAQGLAHLAKSGDKQLSELAAADLAADGAGASDAAAQMTLGDRWFDWVEAGRTQRHDFLAAAEYWYRRAAPGLTGLDKPRVEKLLADIGPLPRKRTAGGSAVASATPTVPSPPTPTPPTPSPANPLPESIPGGTAPPLPKNNSPAEQLAFNRAMAEWALGKSKPDLGVLLPDGSKKTGIKKAADLPAGPLMITNCHLTGSEVVDGDVPQLAALAQLELISLSGNAITDKGLRALGGSRSLQMMRVNGLPLSDETLAELCRNMPQLSELQISATAVTDQGLEAVGKLPSLERLYLADDDISDAGLTRISRLRGLQNLILDGTKVTNEGLKQVGLHRELIYLHLASTAVDDDGMQHLSGLSSLRDLDVSETNVGNAGLVQIAKIQSLQKLTLAQSKVTGAGLASLRGMPNLLDLGLHGLEIEDEELAALRGIPQLRSVILDDSTIGDAALDHLAQIRTLTSVRLVGTRVTDAGVARLQAALPKVKISR